LETKGVVPFSYYEVTVPSEAEDKPPVILQGKVFERNPEIIGLINLEGKHPEKAGEISLCVGTAQKYGKSPGDSIQLLVENEIATFLVTGIYQDISNLGEGFRLPLEAVKNTNPVFEPDKYALVLNDKNNAELFKSVLLKKYGESIKIDLTIEDQLGFMGITKSINASLLLISLFFVGVLIVSVFNDVFLSVWENRKTIGIYQLIGFTHRQLRIILIWKMVLVGILSILTGTLIIIFIGPRLMGFITSGFGVVDFPMDFSVAGTVLASFLFLFITVFSTFRASQSIKQINPKILVNE